MGGMDLSKASSEQRAQLGSTLTNISRLLGGSARGGGSGGGGGITSDSGDASRTERTIGSDIESISRRAGVGDEPDTSALDERREAQDREIERQRRLLEQRRSTAVAGIEEGFAVERDATVFQQSRETGQTSVDLARAGGYLGVTASQSGVMQNLVIAQRGELRALESAKQDSINQANQAYEDRDFELAQEKLKSAREIESEIFNRRNVFFNQQMDMLGEERAQSQNARENTQFLRDQSNERIDRIIEAGIVPELDDITQIARGLNMSVDETSKIIAAAKTAKDLAEKDQKTDRELAILSRLAQIPRDQSVVIDGVTYRGLASLPAASRASSSDMRAQREDQQKREFAQALQGFWGGREDNEKLTIPIEQAITNFPDLDPKYIESMYKIIDDVDNKKLVADKISSGDWDVARVDYGSASGPVEVLYDKNQYEQAVRNWASQEDAFDTGWWTSGKEQKTIDQQTVPVIIDGEILQGKGVWDEPSQSYVPPINPDDFAITNP